MRRLSYVYRLVRLQSMKAKRFTLKDPKRWASARKFVYEQMGDVAQFKDARMGLLLLGCWFHGYDTGFRSGQRRKRR